jgi:hypothetical protein
MSGLWAFLTAVLSLTVAGRMVLCANRMNGTAPQRVKLAVSLLAAAAFTYGVSPMFGTRFSWPDVVFAGAVAAYVLLDRRKPA